MLVYYIIILYTSILYYDIPRY